MFNFFKELKSEFLLTDDFFNKYTMINLSGKMLYVEGKTSILEFKPDIISFRIKKGVISVKGTHLTLNLLSKTTICIKGNIISIEEF